MHFLLSRALQRARFPSSIIRNVQRPQSTNKPPHSQPQCKDDKVSCLSDPYLLPLSSPALDSHPSDPLNTAPIARKNETVHTLRARLVYQTRKRGTLEADLLLSTFAGEHLRHMGEAELCEFDKLLDEPDWDIYYWVIRKREPPPRWKNSSLLAKLQTHAANESKVGRRMPDLSTFPK